MKQQWTQLAARFTALSLRERLWIALALVLGVALTLYTLVCEPAWKRYRQLQMQMSEQTAAAATARQQLHTLQQRLNNPDAQLQEQLAHLRQDIEIIDTRLREMERTLISPQRMPGLLESILRRNERLQLVELRKLPVTALIAKSAAQEAAKDTAGGIYKHGVEITVQGAYADLAEYLLQLEKLPQQLVWGEIKLATEEYPRNRMTIVVYTLSLDKAWLTV